MSKPRNNPGITVYKPKNRPTWSYRLELPADPLTNDRQRENRGGFATEDDAWNAALESQAAHNKGHHVKPSRRKVDQFLDEWLDTIKDAIKQSTHQNYVDYATAYVKPTIGKKQLQGELTVQVLNAFYRHLLNHGRIKPDNNSVMYEYWLKHKSDRDGRGASPEAVAAACKTTIHAARSAVARYRRGRIAKPTTPGLAPKTVQNIHRMLHRALGDAVAWQYVALNPAEHARPPRIRRSAKRRTHNVWTVDELAAWLNVALADRFAGMWVLAATTGMRRSELAGVTRDKLDLDRAMLAIEDTRVVVAGAAVDEDGKSDSGWREISLDAFTGAALRSYVEMLDKEREAFGPDYTDHGTLMCFEDGRTLHPDTITRTFNRLVDRAGVRRIRLHDVRHTYATLALDKGIDPKILSDRVGHAHMGVTLQIYGHRSTGKDRGAAEQLGNLISDAIRRRISPDEGDPDGVTT